MATFVGFYTPKGEIYGEEGGIHGDLQTLVKKFRHEFKAHESEAEEADHDGHHCRLVGSWAIAGGAQPGVMVIETHHYACIRFINNYYRGWMEIDWHPTSDGGVRNDPPEEPEEEDDIDDEAW